ncbi:hypothetical protein CONCODRAFT_4955 [Conidiobolus coronatus NRRL 28638]|uniref:G-protein coupled receptors family 1 profile domain-containing protein n=1 Tax=Conidiobolus coronatus (strain ATCC 28846 / CBS 209.66 / NRRL 28638) TaxID=796925 RepID=A0A137PB19_CONC2|nr:hypothetical protein CONCODRAFT_4955 [Conidiobolus coronatus NRRL 28638]|eukprot:KXN72210.1 hypothetical protein CONCODRAFT_4955 [Conidiobolus coronatus NRRL 28638]
MLECFLVFTSAISNLISFSAYLDSVFSCSINAILTILTAATSINLVGIVAIERYFLIVKGKPLSNRAYYMLILGLELLNLSSCIFGGTFNGFSINPTSVYCLFDLNNWAGKVGNIIIAISLGISLSMIYFGYINIMIKRRTLTLQNQRIFPFKAEKIKRDANSTIFKSALIIIASTFTNLPYCVLLVITLIYPQFLTPLIGTLCTWSIMFNMIINTTIVLRLRTDLWIELKKLLYIKSDDSDVENDNIDDYQLAIINEESNDILSNN